MTPDEIGRNIAMAVESVAKGSVTLRRTEVDDGQDYHIAGERYRLWVRVQPKRALILELTVLRDGVPILAYSVDTDLYDISREKYKPFARDVEQEIVNLITALADGRIMVGVLKGKCALVVPSGSGVLLATRGRFSTTFRSRQSLGDAVKGGQFEPLV